jgi:hypothetical protein
MRLPISSWTLFIITTFGLVLLLVAQRPQLQGEDGRMGPGQVVGIVGHTITWGATAALTVRMIRSVRQGKSAEEGQGEPQPPQTGKV